VHYKRVDRTHAEEYNPETILKWKSDHEAEGQDALVELVRPAEDTLENIIIEAFQAKQDQIIEILERLEFHDHGAAALLRR
jgi:hypothetical protein